MKARVYTTSWCAYCKPVKKFLLSKGIEVEEVNADDPSIREELIKATGAMTVPVTIIGEDAVIGWSPTELTKIINKNKI